MACAVLALSLVGLGRAQDTPEKAPPMDQEKMMEAWMKANAPGEPHEFLKKFVGDWKVVSRYRPDPGAPWAETSGTSEIKMIMGDRFLLERVKGQMEGMPWEGMGVTGYDNAKKKYTSTWIDSMTTGIMIGYGDKDEHGPQIVFHGTYDDPISGQKDKPNKTILKFITEKKYVTEMYEKDEKGDWYKNLEVTYTRE